VLGKLDSLICKATTFSLSTGKQTFILCSEQSIREAWEIWNEPANPTHNTLLFVKLPSQANK
jgi:hypothetical protein